MRDVLSAIYVYYLYAYKGKSQICLLQKKGIFCRNNSNRSLCALMCTHSSARLIRSLNSPVKVPLMF